jgi:hypothetical protein
MEEIMKLRIWKYGWEQKKSSALEEIKIEVKLHRLIFSGNYHQNQLVENLGNMKIEGVKDKNYRKRNYERMAYKTWCNGKKLRIFYHRSVPVLPKCIIEISYPSKECLIRLNESLPGLNPSSIELTLDLCCSGPKAVRRFFNALLKYCYVPRTSKLKFHRGHSPKNRQSPKLNCSYYMGSMKIYERGQDKSPWGEGWHRSELDRVRVEFKANRQVLRDNGINSLDDLVRSLNFGNIFLPRFHFKVFRRSALLPKENDLYAKLHGRESFQKQLVEARKQGIPNLNRKQCIVDAHGFSKLKKRIVRKIREFDRKWKK